ncbi:MAG: ABC transporter permease subunit [Candidatus Micrarchaeia archaeon]
MRRRYFMLLLVAFFSAAFLAMGPEAFELIYFAFRSFIRMASAYALSILFSFIFGILIIHNKKAYEFIFPVLDVLQAVPILGFFPFAIMFFVLTFPGGMLGQELSSIFLIFTSMTWAVVFAVVESGSSITSDIRDLAKLMNLNGFRYLTHVCLPISLPQFISGSITGWGGGWYFLVASEYLALGNEKIALPGLGAFIARSAFSFNLLNSFIGIIALAFLVFAMDFYFWQPLLRKARAYSIQPVTVDADAEAENGRLVRLLEDGYSSFSRLLERFQAKSQKILDWLSVTPWSSTSHEAVSSTASYVLTGCVALAFFYFLLFRIPSLAEDFAIFSFMARSIIRILVAFAIALFWTSLFALFFARNKNVMKFMMPVFDLGQSIPAVSIFPVLVVVVIQTLGDRIGLPAALEIASVLLVLTGMQWYLLFNLIRAVQNIPDDIMDISKLLHMGTISRLRHLLIPAIMPAVFVGALEAIGGGWNASIVSEFIISPAGTPYDLPGLGNLLSLSSVQGNLDGVFLAVSCITLLILIPNQLIWRPLVRESYKYKF